MNSNITVSIITPVYNSEKYINRVSQCLENQTYVNFEWIIINDCSSDNSDKIIKNILSTTKLDVKYIQNEKNLGVSFSRNKGLDIAQGKYICFLDSDDFWESEKLEVQVSFMESNNIKLSYMDYNQVDPEGNYIRKIIAPKECDYNRILYSDVLGNLTCMVRKDIVGEVRFIKHGHEDYIFWLNILPKIDKAVKVPDDKIYCHYTISGNSLSGNKFRSATWQWKIYRNILKLNLFSALRYFFVYAIKGINKHFL